MLPLLASLLLSADPGWEAVLQSAMKDHRACQKVRPPCASASAAAAGYEHYLAAVPDDPRRWDIRFFQAELEWTRDHFERAAELYREVLLSGQGHFVDHAGHNQVLAWAELRRASPAPSDRPHDGRPWPLTVEQQRMVDAIDLFVRLRPQAPDAGPDAIVAAILYSRADDVVNAERRLREVVVRFKDDVALKAALELLDLPMDLPALVATEQWLSAQPAIRRQEVVEDAFVSALRSLAARYVREERWVDAARALLSSSEADDWDAATEWIDRARTVPAQAAGLAELLRSSLGERASEGVRVRSGQLSDEAPAPAAPSDSDEETEEP